MATFNILTIGDELRAVGLTEKGLTWDAETIYGRENLSEEDSAALDAVIAAHDPTKPAANAFTYKSDLFDRCANDTEALTILGGVAAMGARLDAFFHAVDTIQHSHPLFPQLMAGFKDAFGPDRAAELLAPSV